MSSERAKTDMYSYEWDSKSRGYILTTRAGKYVANEIRPVFAEELILLGMNRKFTFDCSETRPLMWAQKNNYFYKGEKIAQTKGVRYDKPIEIDYSFDKRMKLQAVDVDAMIEKNAHIMSLVIADSKRRVKEMYDSTVNKSDIAYIAFSGGKDSIVTLDICHQTLPLSVPVIYSDTDMELPASIDCVWPEVQKLYAEREFVKVKADTCALENWEVFGPPSRNIRWCCYVHKSTPAILYLKKRLNIDRVKATAFLGVRNEESESRSHYDDISIGVKNASQTNCMPILEWGAHELWLYIFANKLIINPVYRSGLARVGCFMCPQSSEKYVWFVDELYPNELKRFCDVIIKTSNKVFSSKKNKNEFIGSLNWQARQSGVALIDPLAMPIESFDKRSVRFKSLYFNKQMFVEWIKTTGNVQTIEYDGDKKLTVTLDMFCGVGRDRQVYENIVATLELNIRQGLGCASFFFPDTESRDSLLPTIRQFLKKAISCVGCGTCEAECLFGAIKTLPNKRIEIASNKCVHCKSCYEISKSCWRFRSMAVPETSKTTGINLYKNFGLRENEEYGWVSKLVELGENFFPWVPDHPLGKNMIPSAKNWFAQAELIDSAHKPKKLVDLFRKQGSNSILGWEFIWFALTNNALLLKWFVSDVEIGKIFKQEELITKLSNFYPTASASAVEGGMASLKDMLIRSPLGQVVPAKELAQQCQEFTDESAVVLVSKKGKIVQSLARRPKNVRSLTLLYSLYFIARNTERSAFTVREMLSSDKDSSFVSPIVAFGLDPEKFRRQCEGLRSRYPDYIGTVFTHGNDEIEVFPERHTLDDIVALCISES